MVKTKPVNAQTAVLLSKGGLNILQRRANLYRPMLGLGLVAGVLAFMSPMIAVIPAAGCIWLGVHRFRWRSMAEVTRSTPIDDYLLTDDADLRWMAWAIELEPRAKLLAIFQVINRAINIAVIGCALRYVVGIVCKTRRNLAHINGAKLTVWTPLLHRVKEKRALWQAAP